jgi:DNA-binding MarR family transcriptional regulator
MLRGGACCDEIPDGTCQTPEVDKHVCASAILACVQASIGTEQATSKEELTLHLAGVMKHLMVATGRDFFQAVEELGLSLSQLKSLQALGDAQEPLSLKGLADHLGLSLPAVSRAVDGLVQRGYVTREEDPSDRRCKRLLITRRGRRTVEGLLALRVAGLREFVERLEPDEREALARGLRPIVRRDEVAAHIPERKLAR